MTVKATGVLNRLLQVFGRAAACSAGGRTVMTMSNKGCESNDEHDEEGVSTYTATPAARRGRLRAIYDGLRVAAC